MQIFWMFFYCPVPSVESYLLLPALEGKNVNYGIK